MDTANLLSGLLGALIGALVAGAVAWLVARGDRNHQAVLAIRLPAYQEMLDMVVRFNQFAAVCYPTWPPGETKPDVDPTMFDDVDLVRIRMLAYLAATGEFAKLQFEWTQSLKAFIPQWHGLKDMIKSGTHPEDPEAVAAWEELDQTRTRMEKQMGAMFSHAADELGISGAAGP